MMNLYPSFNYLPNPPAQHVNQGWSVPVGQAIGTVVGNTVAAPIGGSFWGGAAGGHFGQGLGDLTGGNWSGLYNDFATDFNRDMGMTQYIQNGGPLGAYMKQFMPSGMSGTGGLLGGNPMGGLLG